MLISGFVEAMQIAYKHHHHQLSSSTDAASVRKVVGIRHAAVSNDSLVRFVHSFNLYHCHSDKVDTALLGGPLTTARTLENQIDPKMGKVDISQSRHTLTNVFVRKKLKEQLTNVSASSKDVRVPRWYFGGLASAGAACITHPLDTMKVYYQTTGQLPGSQGLLATTLRVIKTNGFFALYNGLSASILRQLTYSTTRFAIYELAKQRFGAEKESIMPLYKRTLFAAVSGAAGGLVGAPADVVNVRMQNDIKLPMDLKRNYGNAIRGLYVICKEEGVSALFQGSSMAIARAVFVSIGQLAMYDQYKYLFVTYLHMPSDEIKTHVTSSIFTSITCTTLTQPLDVLKTRMMNASGSGRQSAKDAILDVYRSAGPIGYFKGFVPALIRLIPHTILVFVFYEQLRIRFGLVKSK